MTEQLILSLFTTGIGALAAAVLESPLEVTVNPTIEPIGPRAGSPQAKQLPGREYNLTHQQSIRLQLYWVRLCPPEQDPVFPTDNSSHHEAYTSLLVSSIRGQKEEARKKHSPTVARTKITLQKVNQDETSRKLCPRWRDKIKSQKNN